MVKSPWLAFFFSPLGIRHVSCHGHLQYISLKTAFLCDKKNQEAISLRGQKLGRCSCNLSLELSSDGLKRENAVRLVIYFTFVAELCLGAEKNPGG